MLLHAATSAARALDDAPPRRAAVFPSIPVAPPPVAPLNSPLYLPPSASPSARYPSNSWTSFVPSAVARLYPVPTASSILTLADLQCRDRLRIRGITGVDLDSILRHTFSDITNPSFIFRDTNAPFADPLRNATAFVNAPLSPHRASLSLQHVLRCIGMPPDEAALYSPACCRRFLPTVSRFCGMSADLRVELGRWCGSLSAALPDSPPAATSTAESLARMPDLYSRAHAEQIVLPILQQAIDACAAVVTRLGVPALPLHGGWDLFETLGADG